MNTLEEIDHLGIQTLRGLLLIMRALDDVEEIKGVLHAALQLEACLTTIKVKAKQENRDGD